MTKKHEIIELPYDYDALEPYIDEETMRIHHDKHHQGYADKFNKAIENNPETAEKEPEELLKDWNLVPKEIMKKVRNFGGGYVNHNFFWTVLKKDMEFKGEIAEAIKEKFGSFEKFKEEFSAAAATVFGSGWAWLVLNEKGELEIMQTKNQDSPLSYNKTPLLTIDVWEHAYYLKYQNKRKEFIDKFFNIINWEKVNEYYLKAKQ